MRAPEFWWRKESALGGLLAPVGWFYGAATRLRFAAARPWVAAVPVLCVGNAVAGGAGKTPVAMSVGRHLQARGRNVHFLGRGYGGSASGPLAVSPGRDDADTVGDEALLLAAIAPTWVSRDRVAGARAAQAGADVIVMDDGFQDPSVRKGLSLLVADGRRGFGNGHMIPAGPLRETVGAALSRAGAVAVIGPDEAGVADDPRVRKAGLPVLGARAAPGPEAERLRGRAVVAFAGTGDPGKFFATLREIGCQVAETRSFPDHHPYTAGDVERLRSLAEGRNAGLVTTEKDAQRLPPDRRNGIEVLTISIEWEDEAALDAVLDPLFAHR